jgi:hypothetical protein
LHLNQQQAAAADSGRKKATRTHHAWVKVADQAIAANCVRDKEGFFFQIDKSEEALSKEQMEFVKCGVDAAVHTVLVDRRSPRPFRDRGAKVASCEADCAV